MAVAVRFGFFADAESDHAVRQVTPAAFAEDWRSAASGFGYYVGEMDH